MNISKKQISLGALAAVAVVAVPVATVISCGKKDTASSVEGKNVIDLNQMNSPQELIDTINDKLGLAMSERVDLLAMMDNAGKLKEESFNKIKKYMDGMNSNNFKELIVKIGDEEVKWDLTKLLTQVNKVKKSLSTGYANIKDHATVTGQEEVPSAGGLVAFLGGSKGLMFGLALTGFSELDGAGYEGYNGILDAYHEFAVNLTTSAGFKKWMNDKEYQIISYDYDLMTHTFDITDTKKYKTGEGIDDSKVRAGLLPIVKSEAFKKEGNNFEAQWITSILKMI
ncbi:MAG: hypothetical protein HRT98_02780 [Mycoplasmatales bacterium]|nr:hypothetical protein [Mycoplasmatales bacterium]